LIPNYLVTENPFKLAAPPQWWLTQLGDYDAQLPQNFAMEAL